jgi:hypothetical protein
VTGGELALQADGPIGQVLDHRGDRVGDRGIGGPMQVGLDPPGPIPGLAVQTISLVGRAPE